MACTLHLALRSGGAVCDGVGSSGGGDSSSSSVGGVGVGGVGGGGGVGDVSGGGDGEPLSPKQRGKRKLEPAHTEEEEKQFMQDEEMLALMADACDTCG